MTPFTITKDEYSGKWVAWNLPSDKVVDITSEGQSQVFWKCTSNFYLLGVGETEKQAVAKLERKVADFISWIEINRQKLRIFDIASNLPEYRQAIYKFNTKDYQHTDNV
jgi:hypothetical protein